MGDELSSLIRIKRTNTGQCDVATLRVVMDKLRDAPKRLKCGVAAHAVVQKNRPEHVRQPHIDPRREREVELGERRLENLFVSAMTREVSFGLLHLLLASHAPLILPAAGLADNLLA